MEAHSRFITVPRQALLVVAVVVLAVLSLAAGYAIRFATAPTAAATHTTAASSQSGSAADATGPGCVSVGGHKGC